MSEFARCYHSKERVEFVKSLPCVVVDPDMGWFCEGDVDNHHTENGGTGRKADYQTIVPLCDGHHFMLHNLGCKSFEQLYSIDLQQLAADTESRWQAYLNTQTPESRP